MGDDGGLLGLEPWLVQRLREALGPSVDVQGHTSLEDLAEGALPRLPALGVVWGGYKVLESGPQALAARVAERWLTVVVVGSAQDARSGHAARALAQALVSQVLQALSGAQPWPEAAPLALDDAPREGVLAQRLFVPLAWRHELVVPAPPALAP